MMRKFIRFMATAVAMIVSVLSMTAAEPVTFTPHDTGSYLKMALWSDASFAVIESEYNEDYRPISRRCILFSEKMEKIHEFSIPDEYGGFETLAVISNQYGLGVSTSNHADIVVTQYLFNEDDLYEYVVYEKDNEEYIYKIYNERGDFLGECPGIDLYVGNDVIYFYTDSSSLVYSLNKKKETMVSEIRDVPQGLRSIPNPVGENETVTVLLPEGVCAGATVQVYSMNGGLLVRRECKAGEMSVEIAAHALSRGINPVIVVDADGNVVSSGKIVRE